MGNSPSIDDNPRSLVVNRRKNRENQHQPIDSRLIYRDSTGAFFVRNYLIFRSGRLRTYFFCANIEMTGNEGFIKLGCVG